MQLSAGWIRNMAGSEADDGPDLDALMVVEGIRANGFIREWPQGFDSFSTPGYLTGPSGTHAREIDGIAKDVSSALSAKQVAPYGQAMAMEARRAALLATERQCEALGISMVWPADVPRLKE